MLERKEHMTTKRYENYTHAVSGEPSYYGSEVTIEDCNRIVQNLSTMIETEFPGIQVFKYYDGHGGCKTTGPDKSVCDEIDKWVEENWTKSL